MGQTIYTKIVDSGGGTNTGQATSQAVVNGNPAICYYNVTLKDLIYVRANDAGGTSWGAPQTLDSAGDVGASLSLAVVNGKPAVCYLDTTNLDLKYVRANDANGTSWGTPQTVDGVGNVGPMSSLAVINGAPAISYYDVTNRDLKFVRAGDADGASWGTPLTLDTTGDVGNYTSLAEVNGAPAISYMDFTNQDLKFVRALNANGTLWDTPLVLDSSGLTGYTTSLKVINGNPAISYYDFTNGDLRYIRASNAAGSAWGAPVAAAIAGNVGNYCSLAVINGNPAISYYDATNGDLKYVRATDVSGTSWGTALTPDSTGDLGFDTSLVEVNGSPAISYRDLTNRRLKWAMIVEAPAVTSISPGSGSTAGGTSVTITGTGFLGATGATVGGVALTSFSVVDATTITGVTGAHASGTVDVAITGSPGGANTGGTGLFTHIAPPTVTLSTATVMTTATTLVVNGSGFDGTVPSNNSVVFVPGGTTGTVTAATDTSLTVAVSGLTAGNLSAVVTTSGLSSGAAVQVATVFVPGPGTLDPLDLGIVGSPGSGYNNTAWNSIESAYETCSNEAEPCSAEITAQYNAIQRIRALSLPGPVYAGVVQADGKFLIAGKFSEVLGVARNNIARINADGTLDTAFDASTNESIVCMALQADGKILIGGAFSTVNGSSGVNHIARLNADGTLDSSFTSSSVSLDGMSGVVTCVAVQADGKVLIGGCFTSVNGTAVINYIARLNADGSLDSDFNSSGGVSLGGANDFIWSVVVQADGKILIGGTFTSVNGSAVSASTGINRIARLNADGTLDSAFNSSGGTGLGGANNTVASIAVQANGKILIGGDFTSVNGSAVSTSTGINRIARLNADGSVDTTFNSSGGTGLGGANGRVASVAVHPSGKILIGGSFSSVNGSAESPSTGVNSVARIDADGSLDTSFNTLGGVGLGGATGGNVAFVALQGSDWVLLGGGFTEVNGTPRNYFARLTNQIVISPPSVTSISPTSGSTAGGTSVTITGTNFSGTPIVTIGGAAATSVVVSNATTLTCITPAGTAGARDVVVTISGQPSTGGTGLFTYVAPIATTTIGFHTASGIVGNYYNGGTDAAGNSGPNVGVAMPTSTAGAGKIGQIALANVPNGFTGAFSCNYIGVSVGFGLNVWSGLNGTGTNLGSKSYDVNGDGVAFITFSGLAKSVTLGKYSGSPSYDNFTFGSATVGTPVAEPPGVTTSAATSVGATTATINASVNPGGAATTAQFEYGLTNGYGSTASISLSPNNGITGQTVSANLSGLTPNSTYYFRVAGSNSVGSRNGPGMTFNTMANNAPTNITLAPSSIMENNTANATVGTLAAVDADSGQTHTFSKVSGTGDTDNAHFNISGTDLILIPSADFETKSSYSVRVQADDGAGGTFAKALTVTITNVNETPPAGTDNAITMNEGATYTFVPADFGFTDPLSSPADNFKTLHIASLPTAGSLLVGGVPAVVGDTVTPSTAQAGVTLVERTNSVASGDQPGFQAILSSGDGMKLAAWSNNGYMRFSSDGGASWVTRTALPLTSEAWAMSRDGSKMIAAGPTGYLNVSTDDGQTWTQLTSAGSRDWLKVVISANGQRIAAAEAGGLIYTSSDGGSTWIGQASSGPTYYWTSLVASDDGMRLAAGRMNSSSVNQLLLTSTDGGATWTELPNSGVRDWRRLACSADGMKLVTGSYSPGSRIFTSVDGGANWTERTTSSSLGWNAVASSADGMRLFATTFQHLETSNDGGATWTVKSLASAPNLVSMPYTFAISSDGTRLAIADYFPMSGKIWTSVGPSTTTPTLAYTAPSVNADTSPLTSFTFQVEDDGGTANGGQVLDLSPNTISLNVLNLNVVPTDITLTPSSIAENNAANAKVGTLAAVDADSGQTHTFTKVTGTGDSDNAHFNISGTDLILIPSADFETKSSYSVRVQADDNNGGTFEKALTVTITNVNETPTALALAGSSVNENVAASTMVGTFSTTDADAGDTSTYSLVTGTGSTDNASFNISGSTLRANAGIDFEAGSTRSIRVRTTDAGGLFFENTFTITVNNVNEVPSFVKGANQVHPYQTSTAQTVASWASSISDGDSTAAQALTFNVSNNNNALFTTQPSIDSSTGTLTYTLSGTSGTATVSVSLTDDNSINGNAALTTAVQTFTITVQQPDYLITTTGNALVITDLIGNSDSLALTQPAAGSILFSASGRTFAINSALTTSGNSGSINLTGINSITVNAAGGSDTIDLGSFTALPSLTINGGIGDDAVNLQGDLTFASNASLDVDLQNDNVTPGIDIVTLVTNVNVLTSGTGTITVRVSRNIAMASGSSFETVNGALTLEANQQAVSLTGNFDGIDVNNAIIRSTGSGDVTVKGKGGTSGVDPVGVLVRAGGRISGGTSGTVAVTGTGGTGSAQFVSGVYVNGASSIITSTGANVQVTGTGGTTTSSVATGVEGQSGATISAGGSGSVMVNGTGGTGILSHGLNFTASTITSSGGPVTVTGTGGGLGSTNDNYGISVFTGGIITAGGSGLVTVNGTGGSGTGGNHHGILIQVSNSKITSGGGNVDVTATPGTGGSGSVGFYTASTGSVTTATNGGTINISADHMTLSGPVTAGTGAVTLRQKTNGKSIDLGAADSATTLGLSDAELDLVTAGTLAIGDSNSGDITISAAISPANAPLVNLITGGSIKNTNASGTTLTVANSTSSGTLAPGASPGIFSVAGNHSLVAGSSFSVEIGGTTVGTQYDQLSATGTVSIGANVTLSTSSFGGFTPSIGQVFTIISRTGGTGIFTGLAEGAVISTNFLGSGLPARISYAGGNGDDVIIRVANPEMSVTGKSLAILSGDITPRVEDGTDFGGILVTGDSVPRVFRVVNTGTSVLSLTGTPRVQLSDTVNFTVGLEPAASVPNGPGSLFQILFDPVSAGVKTCTVSIANDDPNRNPYTFTITGEGQVPEPVEFTVGGVPRNVVTSEIATDAAGLGDGTQFDILGRGGYLANNGVLGVPGTLKIGVGGVTEVPNNFQGYWKSNGSTLRRLIRSSDVAPGTGGALFNAIPTIPVPGLNPDGEVTILTALRVASGNPAVTTSDDQGMWSEVGGNGLQLLMRENDPVPGIAGAFVSNFGYGCYATATTGAGTGEAAFTVKLKGSTTDSVLLRMSITGPGTADVSVVAREKTAAPGTAEQFGVLHSTYTSAVRMDPLGNIVFGAVTRPSNKTGIWSQEIGGALAKVFVAGDVAPDTGGATFAALDMPSMAADGAFTFRGVLNRDGDNTANDKNDGIWFRSDTGFIFPILRRGDSTVTGLPAGGKVGNVWNGWVNLAGEGAWRGWVDTAGDGISPFPADTYGIYTNMGSDMELLISVGDAAPGVAGATFSFMDHPVVGGDSSLDGYLAFLGNITGGGINGSNNKGIWASHNGNAPLLVLRTGDEMPTSQGSKVVSNIDLPGSNMDVRPWQQSVIDNQGRILLFITYTDGTTAQVVIPVFSPSTAD